MKSESGSAATVRRWRERRPVGYTVMISGQNRSVTRTLHHEITRNRADAEALAEYFASHPTHNGPVEFSVVAIYTEPTG